MSVDISQMGNFKCWLDSIEDPSILREYLLDWYWREGEQSRIKEPNVVRHFNAERLATQRLVRDGKKSIKEWPFQK